MAGRAQGRSSGRCAFSPRVGRESRESECKAAYWGGCGLALICVGGYFWGDLGIFVIWQERGGKKDSKESLDLMEDHGGDRALWG